MDQVEELGMQSDAAARLSDVLASYEQSSRVGYAFVMLFALFGFSGCVLLAWGVGSVQRSEVFRMQPPPAVEERGAMAAFARGEFAQARDLFVRARGHGDRVRIDDYLARIELALVDEERVKQAAEAVSADRPDDALMFLVGVTPNSPVYPQADRVARSARAAIARESEPLAPAPEAAPAPKRAAHRARRPRGVSPQAEQTPAPAW